MSGVDRLGVTTASSTDADGDLKRRVLPVVVSEESLDAGDATGSDAGDDRSDPSEATPERPPITGLLETLSVKRNALVGVGVGVALAVTVYLVRALELLGPAAGTREYPILGPEGFFLLLAVVLASATALFVASMLTLVAAIRAIRQVSAE